jgi:hypothetical protein
MRDIDLEALDLVIGGASQEQWVNSSLGVPIRMSDRTPRNIGWNDFVRSGAGSDRRFAMERGLAQPGGSWRPELRRALESDPQAAAAYLAWQR